MKAQDAGALHHSPVLLQAEEDGGEDAGRLCLCQSRRVFYSPPLYLGANGVGQERRSQNE